MRRNLIAAVALALVAGPSASFADEPTVLRAFRCDGRDAVTPAMENEYIEGSRYGGCWFHTGHHTYDLDGMRAVGAISGWFRAVEIQFSPPAELTTAGEIPIVFERSVDGRTWTTIDTVAYEPLATRQDITFAIDAGGAPARYLRVREPRSLAQGLSGYLDVSEFTAELGPILTDAVQPARTGTFGLSCERDLMEGIVAEHPCWFGGINRYDAPSVFHTYPLDAPTTVTSITGSATFLPWRVDDYAGSGGSRQTLQGHLFASLDGEHWTKLVTFDASYGLAAPVTWSGSIEAAYLRLVAEYHRGVRSDPALKHVRGMLVDSRMTVTAV